MNRRIATLTCVFCSQHLVFHVSMFHCPSILSRSVVTDYVSTKHAAMLRNLVSWTSSCKCSCCLYVHNVIQVLCKRLDMVSSITWNMWRESMDPYALPVVLTAGHTFSSPTIEAHSIHCIHRKQPQYTLGLYGQFMSFILCIKWCSEVYSSPDFHLNLQSHCINGYFQGSIRIYELDELIGSRSQLVTTINLLHKPTTKEKILLLLAITTIFSSRTTVPSSTISLVCFLRGGSISSSYLYSSSEPASRRGSLRSPNSAWADARSSNLMALAQLWSFT